jgi:hypothetical protein
MPFSLSFGDDFFNAIHGQSKPKSVYEALQQMPDDDWNEMCACIFPDAPVDMVDPDDVVTYIRETNTCTNLDSPVEVWIDLKGDFRINVY